MKRTKPGIVLCPSLLELDIVADNADDVRLLLNGFLEVAGISHGLEAQLSAGIMGLKARDLNIPDGDCCGEAVEGALIRLIGEENGVLTSFSG
jgi:hypothetical protein